MFMETYSLMTSVSIRRFPGDGEHILKIEQIIDFQKSINLEWFNHEWKKLSNN